MNFCLRCAILRRWFVRGNLCHLQRVEWKYHRTSQREWSQFGSHISTSSELIFHYPYSSGARLAYVGIALRKIVCPEILLFFCCLFCPKLERAYYELTISPSSFAAIIMSLQPSFQAIITCSYSTEKYCRPWD